MNNFGLGLEIISEGEFLAAQKAGFKPDEMLFGGSTRSDSELNLIAHKNIGLISLESISEVKRLNKIAKIFGRKIKVLLRFQPDERYRYGNSLKDLDKMLVNFSGRFPFLVLKGIHEYVQSRVYSVRPFIGQLDHFFSIISHLEKKSKLDFKFLDIGGGFGSDMQNDFPGTIFAKKLSRLVRSRDLGEKKIILELGRYLVNRSGSFFTRVIEVRKGFDTRFIVVQGLINYLIKIFGGTEESRRFLGDIREYKVEILSSKRGKNFPSVICGQMSSGADTFGRGLNCKFLLPDAESGDIVAIKGVGAYGLTQGVNAFGSRPIAAEFLLINGKLELIRDKGGPEDFLQHQRIPKLLMK